MHISFPKNISTENKKVPVLCKGSKMKRKPSPGKRKKLKRTLNRKQLTYVNMPDMNILQPFSSEFDKI